MFVHLHVHSPYSFLDGASSLEALLHQAAQWEMPALAITDHNNVSAAVDFHKLALDLGIKPIQGAEITTEDGTHLTLLAENNQGYQSLCRLITAGFAKGDRHQCLVPWEALGKRPGAHCPQRLPSLGHGPGHFAQRPRPGQGRGAALSGDLRARAGLFGDDPELPTLQQAPFRGDP